MNPVAHALNQLDANSPLYATQFVDTLLAAALEGGASDVHLRPTAAGVLAEWRLDGVLQRIGEFPRGSAADIVSRLKVMAELLTYRTDVPQEGRIRPPNGKASSVEMRVSTFPTLHGERAAIRLFAAEGQYLYVADLGLPSSIEEALRLVLSETSGALLITGPAGSGKTTTAYACLREIVRASEGRRSVVTLEDPIESALDGASQSQVQPAAGFTLAAGLRSLMRQDPEVILVGEIRDTETSQTVFQAALTGHLVLSTFHSGSAAGALSRLLDMGIEPYLLTSGVRAIVHQRLVRRLCACCVVANNEAQLLSLRVSQARVAAGCDQCRHTGYRGRLALAEMLPPLVAELNEAVLGRQGTAALARRAIKSGMTTVFERALQEIADGRTDPAEVRRVFGFPEADRAAV